MNTIDIWSYVFHYLDIKQILQLSINKEIYSIIKCQGWWKYMISRDFDNNLETDNYQKLYYKKFNDKNILNNFTSDAADIDCELLYKNSDKLIKIDHFTATYHNNIYDIDLDDGLDIFFANFHNKDCIKGLYIHNDSIHTIPVNVSVFTNLKRLIVTGCRLWSINLDILPLSLEYLSLTGSNTTFEDLEQSKHLKNLKYLEFDNTEVYFSDNACVPYMIDYQDTEQTNNFIIDQIKLPYLQSLQTIKILMESNHKINLSVLKTFFKNFLCNYPNYKSIIGNHNSYLLSLQEDTNEIIEEIYQNHWNDFYIISL